MRRVTVCVMILALACSHVVAQSIINFQSIRGVAYF